MLYKYLSSKLKCHIGKCIICICSSVCCCNSYTITVYIVNKFENLSDLSGIFNGLPCPYKSNALIFVDIVVKVTYLTNIIIALVRIFPLCVPALSQSARNHLLQLVLCYTSAADDNLDEECCSAYDINSVADDDDAVDVTKQALQPSQQHRWTIVNSE